MCPFKGFEKGSLTPIPDSFFRDLLFQIDDLDELRITLYSLWRIANMEGNVRFLRQADYARDKALVKSLAGDSLENALEKAVQRGTLLKARSGSQVLYFLNTPRSRAAIQALHEGTWQPGKGGAKAPPPERPNVFRLYEENIGPLTPMIADALKDAESTYPAGWIEEAIGEAVKRNKRNWKYIEAILKGWKEKGHAQKQDRRDTEKDRRRYVEGEYADYIEH